MTELQLHTENLPATIDELKDFILIGEQGLKAFKAKLTALKKVDTADRVYEATLKDGQNHGIAVTYAKARLGELLAEIPDYHSTGRGTMIRKELPDGINKKTSHEAQTIARNLDKAEKIINNELNKDKIPTPHKVFSEIQKELNKELKKKREQEETTLKAIKEPIIIHADCIEVFDKVPDIDLLIADPPYFTDGNFVEVISNYLKKVKPTGQAYIFSSADPNEILAYLTMNFNNMELSQILIWNYNNTGQRQPNIRYISNYQICFYLRGGNAPNINKPADGKEQYACQTINAPDARRDERYFKWQKPNELIEHFIKNSSREGEFVFDPFAGTGTTLVTASKLGRIAMGCEKNKDMVNICIQRGCVKK